MRIAYNQDGNLVAQQVGKTPVNLVTEDSIQKDLSEQGTDNLLINGGFDFWQRGTSFTPAGTKKHAADRFCIYDSPSQSTVSQIASSFSNTEFGLKFQRTAGQTGVNAKYIAQTIEIKNSRMLVGKYVTFSFQIKAGASFSGTISSKITSGTQTDDRDALFVAWSGSVTSSKTLSLTTSFQTLSQTFFIASTAKQVAIFFEWTPSGTAGADDSFTIEQLMLNIGTKAAPFKRAGGDIQGELAKCQRYFYAPANGSTTLCVAALGFAETTTVGMFIVKFPVTMRDRPTITEWPTGSAIVYNYARTINLAGTTAHVAGDQSNDQAVLKYNLGTATTAGATIQLVNPNAAGSVAFWANAEL